MTGNILKYIQVLCNIKSNTEIFQMGLCAAIPLSSDSLLEKKVKWTQLIMGHWAFHSASSFPLVDNHINACNCGSRTISSNLPSSLCHFGLSFYST